ncbi:hypothetical protein [Alteribacter aurantiacus]|uniref:hypothetical protein n=1 Tax=Alteribacter aurantiacus TaxID=254410 RepID=UPI000409A78D|nr:hypothetical protein [Alteribacter aurantiacus]
MARYIALGVSGIVLLWAVALLLNFQIYQQTTIQFTVIHPIVDGILFFVILLGIVALLAFKVKSQAVKNSITASVGALFMVVAVVLFFIG